MIDSSLSSKLVRLSSTLGDQVSFSLDLELIKRESELSNLTGYFSDSFPEFQLEFGCVRQLT